ncbi:MAG: hypothetical protein ABSD53_10840 [Terriglobales bacterium]|jgi:hypothetical protein
MKERGWIEPIVERVVGQVLDSQVAQLRTEIVRRVMEEIAAAPQAVEPIPAEPTPVAGVPGASPLDLARAVAEIQLGASQKEILRALLDTSARYATRVALFVVKGSHATGWQARGFVHSDGIKDFALDEKAPAVIRAIVDRVAVTAPVAELDARFAQQFDSPASGEARFFPLILKDKVAALVYADSGTGADGLLEAGALELLVLSTGAWLEVNSLRKQAQKEPSNAENHSTESPSASTAPASFPPVQSVPAFNDPFASHAPAFTSGNAKAAAAGASAAPEAVDHDLHETPSMVSPITEAQSAVAEMEPALAEPLPVGHAETLPVSDSLPAAAALSPEDQDVHRKAQRFARLLVDEIKLYNQAKVAEGRKNKDLYDRLKETIEKSRATYQKRYGTTVAASANYFQHEIIRSLAEDDLSIMGANFRH